MKKLLLGILGGVSLGMLFAPKKGDELRKDLAESDNKIKTFADQFVEMTKGASEEVQAFVKAHEKDEWVINGRKGVEELIGKAKDLSITAKEELTALVESAEKEGKKTIEEGKKAAKKAVEKLKS